jgi:hypothetical protein
MKKRRKSPKKIIEKIKKKLYSDKFKEENRLRSKDFSRKRKLHFVPLVLFMINIIKQTLQKELTHFMELIKEGKENITKSAFSQSRVKLKPEAFIDLNETLVEEFYTDNDYKMWNGFRLCAIDGSKLILPTHSRELMEKFGELSNGMIIPQAQISSCYDVLNEIILDSQLETLQVNEINQATRHLSKLTKGDLVILDRGYAATWFYYILKINNLDFVNRFPKGFRKDAEEFRLSGETDSLIEINIPPQKSRYGLQRHGITKELIQPFKIRLVKVVLDTGEIEVLATTLLDKEKYPLGIFRDLYFKRWGIETNFNHLKSNLNIEEFSGLSEIAIRQDFYANMFINNLQSIIALDSKDEMDEEMKKREQITKKQHKYNYKVNRNLSLGYMKDRIINILTSNNPKYYEELKELFKTNPNPIRDSRKNPRKSQDKNRRTYFMNRKRAV